MKTSTKIVISAALVSIGAMAIGFAVPRLKRYNAQLDAQVRNERTLEMGRRSIQLQLRDPESAKFGRTVLVEENIPNIGRYVIICGSVNAKNAYGGYIGYEKWHLILEAPTKVVASCIDGKGEFCFQEPTGMEGVTACYTELGFPGPARK